MEELYYWMYRGLNRIRKGGDLKFDSLLGVLFLIGINAIVIGRHIHNIVGFNLKKDDAIIFGILIAILQLVVGHFYLYSRKDVIFERINSLSIRRLKKGKNLFIIYVAISLIAFYITTIFY